MKAEELWEQFCEKKNIDRNTPYEAWVFCGGGELGDELADLVLEGKKFGTASAYDEYVLEDVLDELPKVGTYNVILKDNGDAVCVIRDYDVYHRAFGAVTPFHAYSEGEGDRTLAFWREAHAKAFSPELNAEGMPLTDDSLVVCEKFSVEYIAGKEVTEEELLYVEPSENYEKEIADFRQEMLDAGEHFQETELGGNTIFALRRADGKIVGCFQIDEQITVAVRPSEQQKGYETGILAKAKDFYQALRS